MLSDGPNVTSVGGAGVITIVYVSGYTVFVTVDTVVGGNMPHTLVPSLAVIQPHCASVGQLLWPTSQLGSELAHPPVLGHVVEPTDIGWVQYPLLHAV